LRSHAEARELRRGQQTIHEAINSHRIYEPVRGVHPRIELPDEEYEEWLNGNQDVEYVVINFSDAEEVIEKDGDLSQVLEPWHIPIILGTEHDDDVNGRTLQDVLNVLEVAQPAIYIPDVVYSYIWMEDEIQENALDAYTSHVRTLQELVIEHDLDIRLIPTNNGWEYEHFVEYQELYDDFDYGEFAFYAVQYTGGDAGNAINVLQSHVRNVIVAIDPEDVFLIGRLAEDDLLDFAPRVVEPLGFGSGRTPVLPRTGFQRISGWSSRKAVRPSFRSMTIRSRGL